MHARLGLTETPRELTRADGLAAGQCLEHREGHAHRLHGGGCGPALAGRLSWFRLHGCGFAHGAALTSMAADPILSRIPTQPCRTAIHKMQTAAPVELPIHWAPGTYTRVPYAVFQREDVLASEQARVYEGPVWNFLGLEAEVPHAGDFKTTFVGRMPVVVTRGEDGEVYAFENRCAHRGALICLDDFGNRPEHTCVYHAWRYDLQGNLRGVAFEKGVNGKGGMPASFCKEDHGPRKLRTTVLCGLVFGSLSEDVPPIDEYLGDEVMARLERVLGKPVEVIGR